MPPYGALCPLPHPELSATLPALPPASFPLPITAFRGKRRGPGKADERELPKPETAERHRTAGPGDGPPAPPERTHFHSGASRSFRCRLNSASVQPTGPSSPEPGWEVPVEAHVAVAPVVSSVSGEKSQRAVGDLRHAALRNICSWRPGERSRLLTIGIKLAEVEAPTNGEGPDEGIARSLDCNLH